MRCGCLNYRAHFQAELVAVQDRVDQAKRQWSSDPIVRHAFNFILDQRRRACDARVIQVDSVLESWFSSSTSVPTDHIDQVERGIAKGSCINQSCMD